MDKISILLGLSGSEQSKFACEIAWSMAQKCGAKVTAEHVIDSKTIWDLLRNEKPGLIGSGPYVNAYEGIRDSMDSLSRKLASKYDAMAGDKGIESESVISEGNPVQVISHSARHHDFVVIGHQSRSESDLSNRSKFVRYAVAEGLAHECPRPLLVVQDTIANWSSMTILVSFEHINFSYINACISLANALSLKTNIVAIGSGAREESPEHFLRDVREAHPELKNVDIDVHTVSGIAATDFNSLSKPNEIELDWMPEPDTLMVIPTRESGGSRITVFDTSPSSFVRYLALPTILLWPEESVQTLPMKLSNKREVQQA